MAHYQVNCLGYGPEYVEYDVVVDGVCKLHKVNYKTALTFCATTMEDQDTYREDGKEIRTGSGVRIMRKRSRDFHASRRLS